MRLRLKEIELTGYKSIDNRGQKISINEDITVFIGANGVGKSNIVSFFDLLAHSMSASLQAYIGENGFSDAFLHYGSKNTSSISVKIGFQDQKSTDEYKISLAHAVGDILIYTEESFSYQKKGEKNPFTVQLSPGQKESQLSSKTKLKTPEGKTASIIYQLLKGCRTFHFEDTSKEAKIRNKGFMNDNRYLRDDAGNLAAFLYAMKTQDDSRAYYERIVRYIQEIMPQFGDFLLLPSVLNENYIQLDWQEKDRDYIFGAHQLSDGTLRFMALATLLLQPAKTKPPVIVLDEPELGLHPTAIAMLAGMIKTASTDAQIIIATQSPQLVDEFELSKISVIERDEKNRTSVFKNLDPEKLEEWLKVYSVSELWDKNVIGGKP